MNNKIVFATSNEGKMKEIREIMSAFKGEIKSLKEDDIIEKGQAVVNSKIICEIVRRMPEGKRR